MCGIAGIVGKNVRRHQHLVKQMTDAINHRGPDGDGNAAFDNCVLGHRRLSIVDLTTGDQPMYSPYNTSIAFNGEFYGYKEVKQTLDYPFKTSSDTEVILALYHKYGVDNFVQHVKGMFAFTIWDEANQLFIAARDRFGEKPFYYTVVDGQLIYASELKAILASGLVNAELDTASLSHYLQHLYVHPHHSIYKNIFVLPPAHYLVFKNGEATIKKYWQLPEKQLTISFEEAKEECYRLLDKSVQQQLVADVKVGAFLSGGLDSSTITALAAMHDTKQLTTISFSFGNDKSELPFSREISNKYKTNNIELHQDDFDIASWFEEMVNVYDEPFADSSNIPTYLISKAAAKELKVVLTGDAGDELFAGYSSWYQPLVQMKQSGFEAGIKNFKKKLLNPHYRNDSIAAIHVQQNSYFKQHELNELCLFNTAHGYDKFLQAPINSVDAAMRQDLQDYMPGDILVKTDRAAMANSLELRAPFLDVEFAEFCIALPERFKIDGKQDKILMRDTFKNLWTPSILNRKKQGFGAPVNQWLQQKGMEQLKHNYLLDKNNPMFRYINFEKAKAIAAANNYQTWILLNLAIWMQRHKP